MRSTRRVHDPEGIVNHVKVKQTSSAWRERDRNIKTHALLSMKLDNLKYRATTRVGEISEQEGRCSCNDCAA